MGPIARKSFPLQLKRISSRMPMSTINQERELVAATNDRFGFKWIMRKNNQS
jgi:hypothetical protein